MRATMTSSWAMLIALGAFHGINPGMGWLFAVALGMQERRRGAVLARAACRSALGHALAVAAAVARGRLRSARSFRRRAALVVGAALLAASACCDCSATGIRAGPACAWVSAG